MTQRMEEIGPDLNNHAFWAGLNHKTLGYIRHAVARHARGGRKKKREARAGKLGRATPIFIASSRPSTRRIKERRDVPEIAPSFISMPVELPPGVHGKFH
jgi:hypothetical protein